MGERSEILQLIDTAARGYRLQLEARVAEGRGDLDFAYWLRDNRDNIMLALTAAGVLLAWLALRR